MLSRAIVATNILLLRPPLDEEHVECYHLDKVLLSGSLVIGTLDFTKTSPKANLARLQARGSESSKGQGHYSN